MAFFSLSHSATLWKNSLLWKKTQRQNQPLDLQILGFWGLVMTQNRASVELWWLFSVVCEDLTRFASDITDFFRFSTNFRRMFKKHDLLFRVIQYWFRILVFQIFYLKNQNNQLLLLWLLKTWSSLKYTAIPYRASTGPEQGFPCELFLREWVCSAWPKQPIQQEIIYRGLFCMKYVILKQLKHKLESSNWKLYNCHNVP